MEKREEDGEEKKKAVGSDIITWARKSLLQPTGMLFKRAKMLVEKEKRRRRRSCLFTDQFHFDKD